ncbi:hypothetical protein ACLOJK_018141 [Asimina triloba]
MLEYHDERSGSSDLVAELATKIERVRREGGGWRYRCWRELFSKPSGACLHAVAGIGALRETRRRESGEFMRGGSEPSDAETEGWMRRYRGPLSSQPLEGKMDGRDGPSTYASRLRHVLRFNARGYCSNTGPVLNAERALPWRGGALPTHSNRGGELFDTLADYDT